MQTSNEELWYSRTLMLTGDAGYEKLRNAHIMVAGLGGVGAYAADNLVRAGLGEITIIDGDLIQLSNLNRQLPALRSTTGRKKAEVMAERLMDINPQLRLNVVDEYIKDERMLELLCAPLDYVVDAIDTLSPKVYLIYHSLNKGLRIISSMGAGGKFDPALIQLAGIEDTYNCQLAQAIRKRLHKLGIHKGFKVVFSPEVVPKTAFVEVIGERNKKTSVGTISYMPAVFGCFCASAVIRDILEDYES